MRSPLINLACRLDAGKCAIIPSGVGPEARGKLARVTQFIPSRSYRGLAIWTALQINYRQQDAHSEESTPGDQLFDRSVFKLALGNR